MLPDQIGKHLHIPGWPRFGSVRLRFGDGTVRAVPVSVPAVPLRRGFLSVSVQFHREDGSGSGFGSWKTVPAVPVPRSVPGENGSDGSGFRFRFGSWATLIFSGLLKLRKAPDTFNFLRHVMRAILSVRPKCSHRCVCLRETP